MRWVSKRDLTVTAALLLAALLLLWLQRSGAGSGARFEIAAGGQTVFSGELAPDREFSLEGRHAVTFTVRNGKIAITQSDCPDKTCVRTGFIGVPGQITACLPNGLLVRIVGEGGVDAVV